ncbi:hypothetical protein U9M48_009147 [Paspalum notatum var. saurae]|uniref:Uncharacterized protein n=1 Tax=Paspalum notatum var. saurae TaxID=547442 RepID=A0AAQ3WES4_PASNO
MHNLPLTRSPHHHAVTPHLRPPIHVSDPVTGFALPPSPSPHRSRSKDRPDGGELPPLAVGSPPQTIPVQAARLAVASMTPSPHLLSQSGGLA